MIRKPGTSLLYGISVALGATLLGPCHASAAPAAPAPTAAASPESGSVQPSVPGTPSAPGGKSSVVTEEMRAANAAASASAEDAIAKLKAARAAVDAEKSKASQGAGAGPGGGAQNAPVQAVGGAQAPAAAKADAKSGSKVVPVAAAPAVEPAAAAEPPKTAVVGDAAASKKDIKESKEPAGVKTAVSAGESGKPVGQNIKAAANEVNAALNSANGPEGSPAAGTSAAPASPAEGTPAEGTPAEAAPKKKSRFANSDDAMDETGTKKKGKKGKEPVVKLSPEEQKAAEIKAFCDKARAAILKGENEVAQGLLESLVAVDLPDSEKKVALKEVAAVYEEKGEVAKSIAIYEKLCVVLEGDRDMPEWLLKLGMLYRDAGAYQMAISRYYGVIQLSMKVGSSDFARYQGLTRQAQREVANTYFVKGDFDQAQKFYNMALRTELTKEERAVIMFRAGHCTFMRNDMHGAINALERFLKDYSRHPSAAEARYMLATAYRSQSRAQDAYDSVIDLLRDAKGKAESDPKAWAFWQKKAGNEFANDYYQRGEFVNAVTIYQALAAIETAPEWRWPVVYQMGLCFERLRLEPRAAECYKFIVDENSKPDFRWKKMPQSVANLVSMASWRIDQLRWQGSVDSKLRSVAGADLSRPIPR